MRRTLTFSMLLLCGFYGCAVVSGVQHGPVPLNALSESEREAHLRAAVVWSPIDTSKVDVRKGPRIAGLAAGSLLECDFVLPDEHPGGRTDKFLCRAGNGKVYKVKYGRENGELYGEVIGTRLFWALGFVADRVNPVEVHCAGCPEDPWEFMQRESLFGLGESPDASAVHVFVPAIVESYYGRLLEAEEEQGVAWDELLELVDRDPKKAAKQRAHREALTLLASFLQYSDSKPSNQSLACAAGARKTKEGGCRRPVIYLGDLGGILGSGWTNVRMETTKVNFERWSSVDVWRDPERCIAAVHGQPNATLHDTAISEAGRAFLAERLALLGRDQLREIFLLSRFELLEEELEDDTGRKRAVTADDWVDLFLRKARSITEHVCPP